MLGRLKVTAMLRYAAITGWGHCLPDRIVTNKDLESRLDTTDEWIKTRTGISERRIAGPDETTSTLGTTAAHRALICANLAASQVDLVICATTTPDHVVPNTGSLIQQRIGATPPAPSISTPPAPDLSTPWRPALSSFAPARSIACWSSAARR